jgi:hypothetical protein
MNKQAEKMADAIMEKRISRLIDQFNTLREGIAFVVELGDIRERIEGHSAYMDAVNCKIIQRAPMARLEAAIRKYQLRMANLYNTMTDPENDDPSAGRDYWFNNSNIDRKMGDYQAYEKKFYDNLADHTETQYQVYLEQAALEITREESPQDLPLYQRMPHEVGNVNTTTVFMDMMAALKAKQ